MLAAAAHHEAGPFRDQDQDRVLCRPERGLFAVVDGMGGTLDGGHAADVVVEALDQGCVGAPTARALQEALLQANQRLLADARGSADPMGAVVAVVWLDRSASPPRALVCSVGDCRVWLFDDEGSGLQISRDGSWAGLDALPEAQAMESRYRNIVKDGVGLAPVEPERAARWAGVQETAIPHNRTLLLCTDGVGTYLDRGLLSQTVARAGRSPQALLDSLMDATRQAQRARDQGDNIGVVVVRIRDRRARVWARVRGWASWWGGLPGRLLGAIQRAMPAPPWVARGKTVLGGLALAILLLPAGLKVQGWILPSPLQVGAPLVETVKDHCDRGIRPWRNLLCWLRPLRIEPRGPTSVGGEWPSARLKGAGVLPLLLSEPMEVSPGRDLVWEDMQLQDGGPLRVVVGPDAHFRMERCGWDAGHQDLAFEVRAGGWLQLLDTQIQARTLVFQVEEGGQVQLGRASLDAQQVQTNVKLEDLYYQETWPPTP